MTIRSRALALAAVCSLLPALAAASDSRPNLRLHITSDDGDRVDIDLSVGWLASLLDWADVDCDADTDRDTRKMAQSLDRQGDGSRYEFVDDDGDVVVARRESGVLLLDTRDDDGEVAHVEIPWPLAECLFLGREPKEGLGRALVRDGLRIRVDGDDGERVRISID